MRTSASPRLASTATITRLNISLREYATREGYEVLEEVSLDEYPNVVAWMERLEGREATRRRSERRPASSRLGPNGPLAALLRVVAGLDVLEVVL
ncbi:MAG: hypothetical protein M3283_12365 [Actinomycetota bacterium]|nr:hypothetical protein [Actinomycetota bacterium]